MEELNRVGQKYSVENNKKKNVSLNAGHSTQKNAKWKFKKLMQIGLGRDCCVETGSAKCRGPAGTVIHTMALCWHQDWSHVDKAV